MIATFNGNPATTVISCYSPTNASELEMAIKFYEDLTGVIKEIPKHNVKVIAGDMNAQICSEDAKGYTFNNSTRNTISADVPSPWSRGMIRRVKTIYIYIYIFMYTVFANILIFP